MYKHTSLVLKFVFTKSFIKLSPGTTPTQYFTLIFDILKLKKWEKNRLSTKCQFVVPVSDES